MEQPSDPIEQHQWAILELCHQQGLHDMGLRSAGDFIRIGEMRSRQRQLYSFRLMRMYFCTVLGLDGERREIALSDARCIVSHAPDYCEGCYQMARELRRMRFFEQSLEAFARGLRLDGDVERCGEIEAEIELTRDDQMYGPVNKRLDPSEEFSAKLFKKILQLVPGQTRLAYLTISKRWKRRLSQRVMWSALSSADFTRPAAIWRAFERSKGELKSWSIVPHIDRESLQWKETFGKVAVWKHGIEELDIGISYESPLGKYLTRIETAQIFTGGLKETLQDLCISGAMWIHVKDLFASPRHLPNLKRLSLIDTALKKKQFPWEQGLRLESLTYLQLTARFDTEAAASDEDENTKARSCLSMNMLAAEKIAKLAPNLQRLVLEGLCPAPPDTAVDPEGLANLQKLTDLTLKFRECSPMPGLPTTLKRLTCHHLHAGKCAAEEHVPFSYRAAHDQLPDLEYLNVNHDREMLQSGHEKSLTGRTKYTLWCDHMLRLMPALKSFVVEGNSEDVREAVAEFEGRRAWMHTS